MVIQGYGLTETAPIVTLNHPFKTRSGSVGTPIAGVEVKIAEDGEILVRGENVTSGYYTGESHRETAGPEANPSSGRTLDAEGWLHTGDIGEKDDEGRVFIKGRKKEMIVTPEGLNVFPDDVERVLNAQTGRAANRPLWRPSPRARSACTPCSCSMTRRIPKRVIREANQQLQEHQRVRSFSRLERRGDCRAPRAPRSSNGRRSASGSAAGRRPVAASTSEDPVAALLAKICRRAGARRRTSLDDLD